MSGADGESDTRGKPAPQEIPEHVFRRSDDWKFLKAARRERRRRERRERLAALAGAVRDNGALVLAIAAPVALLVVGWMLGAVRW